MDYYNDNDPKTVAWLTRLERAGMLPSGTVDGRDIRQVRGTWVPGMRRCHFFAGIGGWAYALDLAGWPADEPVWTGSCPCQPFSISGKKHGVDDERNLWPAWRDLIAERRPSVVFGEQVASPLGREWLAGVQADVEKLGYRFAAADLCAAGVSAPHIRQRLYWVADTENADGRSGIRGEKAGTREEGVWRRGPPGSSLDGGLAHADQEGRGFVGANRGENAPGDHTNRSGAIVRMGVTSGAGLEERPRDQDGQGAVRHQGEAVGARGAWSDFYLVACSDGKTRRVGSGVFPLAYGVSDRVVKLRGYGNAIVPELAAEFVLAYREARSALR